LLTCSLWLCDRGGAGDPVSPLDATRPIRLTFVEEEGQQKAKILIPSPNGLIYYQLWLNAALSPPGLLLGNVSQEFAAANQWIGLWNMDATNQPDGSQSVCCCSPHFFS
jgi:hypothetical protein